jgi:antitoxin PrlF
MFATLSSKGQITLPKQIRDLLDLNPGCVLDFQVLADHTITARAVKPDARRVRGLLKSPHPTPLSVAQMDDGIARHVRDKTAANSGRRKTSDR